ncbi:MAG: hypothetical protein QM770_23675 [Tepidisphaeraceae bacterium]
MDVGDRRYRRDVRAGEARAQMVIAGFVGIIAAAGQRMAFSIEAHFVGLAMAPVLASSLAGAGAALVLGARQGKYNRDGSANILPGHNLTLQLLGTLVLALLLPAAMGMSGDKPIAGVLLGSSAAICAAAVWTGLRFGKVDVLLCSAAALAGALAGAVAGGSFAPWLAIVVGAVLGVLTPWFSVQIDLRYRIDDPGGLVSPLGMAFVAILILMFVSITRGENALLAGKIIGLMLGTAVVMTVGVVAICLALKSINKLREDEDDEYEGLDLSRHDINAYPDFQQTMIKSYHLRQ